MRHELQTLDQRELVTVTGGGILDTLGQSVLSGALSGAAQGLQRGGLGNGAVWQGLLAGALQGLAGTGASLLQGGGQAQPQAQPQQAQPQQAQPQP